MSSTPASRLCRRPLFLPHEETRLPARGEQSRRRVKDAVKLCTTAGVKTAKAIALECGILDTSANLTEPTIIEGRAFRALSETAREAIAEKISNTYHALRYNNLVHLLCRYKNSMMLDNNLVMGRSSPTDKLLLVQALRRKGHVVAVTGDGTNDAPALHEVVRWGRAVYANIQKFIQFQLTVNVAALVINVVAAVSSGDVPLNAVQCSLSRHFSWMSEFVVAYVRRLVVDSLCQGTGSQPSGTAYHLPTALHFSLMQVLIVEFLGKFMSTVRLDWKLWLVSVAIALVSWPLAVLGKLIPVPEIPLGVYPEECTSSQFSRRWLAYALANLASFASHVSGGTPTSLLAALCDATNSATAVAGLTRGDLTTAPSVVAFRAEAMQTVAAPMRS
ncbi:hypothetical protein BHE74_00035726 [Ensete ventricosum]|nr:hypothetical protein BHE74_00035726 [Ensete ventricosum]